MSAVRGACTSLSNCHNAARYPAQSIHRFPGRIGLACTRIYVPLVGPTPTGDPSLSQTAHVHNGTYYSGSLIIKPNRLGHTSSDHRMKCAVKGRAKREARFCSPSFPNRKTETAARQECCIHLTTPSFPPPPQSQPPPTAAATAAVAAAAVSVAVQGQSRESRSLNVT